mmetsp:Transcript_73251/g.214778  ORF Transcript_73251/g.214778 Transcript_73251/m.214778 type:complete len:222 (-) Transcript_73251:225-890(-)
MRLLYGHLDDQCRSSSHSRRRYRILLHLLCQAWSTPSRTRGGLGVQRGQLCVQWCGSCLESTGNGFALGTVAWRGLWLISLGVCLGRCHLCLGLCNLAACLTVGALRPSERGEASPRRLGPRGHGLGKGSGVEYTVHLAVELKLDAALVRTRHGQGGHLRAPCVRCAAGAHGRCCLSVFRVLLLLLRAVRRKANGVHGSDLSGDERQAWCNSFNPLWSCSA